MIALHANLISLLGLHLIDDYIDEHVVRWCSECANVDHEVVWMAQVMNNDGDGEVISCVMFLREAIVECVWSKYNVMHECRE